MKLKTILAFGLATLLMTACQKDEGIDYNPMEGVSYPIVIDNSIDQQYISRVDDGGFCEGDQVGLYGVNYTNDNTQAGTLLDEGNQVDNARYTYDEAALTWHSQGGVYYKNAETNIDLYAYYPYDHPASVNAYAFEVAQDQSGKNAHDGFAISDFLWAKAENITPSEAKVKLRFSHRLACAHVVLVEGEGFAAGEFDALEKSLLVMNTTRTAAIDLATGVATATGEAPSEGIVMKSNAEGFRAIVVPQTVEAGKALFSITLDGIAHRFKMSEGFVYEAGKQSKFSIRLNKKGHTGEVELQLINTEIVEWVADLDTHGGEARQYYVVHQEEAGTLSAKLRAANKNPNKIKNLKISGKIDAYDFYFMRDQMEILQSINLKETEIVGCKWMWSGTINGQWVEEYFSTEMPQWLEEANNEVAARYPGATVVCSYYRSNSYYLDHEIPASAFSEKSSLVNFIFPEKVTKIGGYAFDSTTFSGALIIPDDVIEIGSGAFEKTNISSLQLPVNLKRIGSYAFNGCSSLAGTLTLPESLESIGDSAFSSCSMLGGTLTIPSQLTEIPNSCFTFCAFTGDLVIPNNIKRIGRHAFHVGAFNGQLTLSSSLTKIDELAFSNTKFQGELVIPKGVQIIESQAFDRTNFSKVVFEEESELVKLGSSAFDNNFRLSEPIILPEGLLSIGSKAFYGCSTLPSVVIPSTVTTIGNNAFSGCYYLTKLQCDATIPPVVGSGAFDGVGKENLTLEVPEQSVALYQT
ncbi:MAG: leucine-rich repeat protein, partial [Alistipes sp.]|nr:leucine-rich repeat protein [Alistipes sp.]